MRPAYLIAAAAAAFLTATAALAAAPAVPAYVTAALADPSRAEDRAQDAERKAVELTVFSGVKPGDAVADIYPGGGYFSRIFARIVGPSGHIYLVQPEAGVKRRPALAETSNKVAASIGPNASVLVQDISQFKTPRPLDVFFSSQFYHDQLAPGYGGPDIAAQNKAVFNALKPGGLYIIVDHSAPNGSGIRDIATTHRIDEAAVKQQMLAAGFVLDGESQMLRNPADARDINVFRPPVRGKTDQMVLRFRKPR